MSILFGAMYICDSCGKEKFIKFETGTRLKSDWQYAGGKILCPDCLKEYHEVKRKEKTPAEIHEDILLFLKAQDEAEERKEESFICPLCGGVAIWGRSRENNHLYAWCRGCGFKLIE